MLKHKLFLIKIGKSSRINKNNSAITEIAKFLENENYVYINHSITSIIDSDLTNTSSNESYNPSQQPNFFKYNTRSKYLAISLIYDDLKATEELSNQLSNKLSKGKSETVLTKPQNVTSLYDKVTKENKNK